MTDSQVYEIRPDIKALNDEYVSLGGKQKELDAEVSAAHDAVATAEQDARNRIGDAQLAAQKAQAALAVAEAEESTKIKTARRALDAATRTRAGIIQRRGEAQREHNDAIADVVREEAAKAEAAKHEKTEE